MRGIAALTLWVVVLAPVTAQADYCAQYGSVSDCGYPTRESCLETISGVGGACVPGSGNSPSESGSPQPGLFRRLLQQQQPLQYPDPAQLPGGTAIPPPPDQ